MFLFGLIVSYWHFFLVFALVVAAVSGVAYAFALSNRLQAKELADLLDKRLSQSPCNARGRIGVINSVCLAGDLRYPRIDIACTTLDRVDGAVVDSIFCISLGPISSRSLQASSNALEAWLSGGGIFLLGDLSVEAKAVRASMDCLQELEWIAGALAKLENLSRSVTQTLSKSAGNELLESSIPQLEQALASFDSEGQRLHEARQNAFDLLGKLYDFVSVPEGIRSILNFDLDQVFEGRRLEALEQSFSEVVALNNAFRDLSRDSIA